MTFIVVTRVNHRIVLRIIVKEESVMDVVFRFGDRRIVIGIDSNASVSSIVLLFDQLPGINQQGFRDLNLLGRGQRIIRRTELIVEEQIMEIGSIDRRGLIDETNSIVDQRIDLIDDLTDVTTDGVGVDLRRIEIGNPITKLG